MKLTYDPRNNVAYIRLRTSSGNVETLRISDELLVDIAPDGSIYGIEFLNANEQMRSADDGQFVLVDASGIETALPLPPPAAE